MKTLKIENINKKYDIEILKDISCSFIKGEIVSIMGESGSGKSTLLNIIEGIDKSYSGRVLYDNVDIKTKKEDYLKNQVGIIFQNFNLISYLNVLDNVLIATSFKKGSLKVKVKKAKKLLIELGLENQIYKYPNQISGGEKQRVAIARALIKDPDIIIGDEPTGSLDSINTKEILNIFLKIAKLGKIVIIATHSEEVSKICHRTLMIKDGVIEKEEINNDFIEYYQEQNENVKSSKFGYIKGISLSIKNMLKKKIKTFMVSVGTSIGIIGLILVLSVSEGIKKYINDVIIGSKNSNILDIYKEKQSNTFLHDSFTKEDIKKIKNMNYVDDIEIGYTNKTDSQMFVDTEKMNVENIKTISKQMTKKQLIIDSFPKENEVLINYYTYEKLNYSAEHIKYNDTVFNISGVYEDGLSETTIYFNYGDIKNEIDEQINVLYIKSNNIEKLKTSLLKEGYYLSYIEESLDVFNNTLNIIIFILSLASFISLIVSSIMIMVVLYIGVIERTKEIGIFRSLGFKGKEIKKIFKSEALLYGFISSVISVCTSIPLLKSIDSILAKKFDLYVSTLNINYMIGCIFVCFIVCWFSSSYPAKKASKINIIDALRYE